MSDYINATHATINGVRVEIVITHDGTRAVQPPYAGGGLVLEDQWHLLTNATFHATPAYEVPTFHYTGDVFDAMRETGRMAPYTAYVVDYGTDGMGYAYSPDGIGACWYDNMEELLAAV